MDKMQIEAALLKYLYKKFIKKLIILKNLEIFNVKNGEIISGTETMKLSEISLTYRDVHKLIIANN